MSLGSVVLWGSSSGLREAEVACTVRSWFYSLIFSEINVHVWLSTGSDLDIANPSDCARCRDGALRLSIVHVNVLTKPPLRSSCMTLLAASLE